MAELNSAKNEKRQLCNYLDDVKKVNQDLIEQMNDPDGQCPKTSNQKGNNSQNVDGQKRKTQNSKCNQTKMTIISLN